MKLEFLSEQEKGGNSGGGPRQRTEALAALNSAFGASGGNKPTSSRPSGGQGSQRAAAVAALSQVLTAEKKPETTHSARSPSAEDGKGDSDGEESKEAEPAEAEKEHHEEESEPKGEGELADDDDGSNLTKYSYEQLRAKSENPVMNIDFKRREAYLAEEEFEGIFEMPKAEFYKLPKWKQDMLKKKHDLF